MQKLFHDPQPQRFEVFTQTKDHSGFTIKNSRFIYKFDSFGGWKDQYGNYYNSHGQPDEEPYEGAITPEQLSQFSDDDFDQYQKEYGPAEHDDFQQEDQNKSHISNMQKIAENSGLLATFSSKKPLRVYFSLNNNNLTEKQLFNYFSSKFKGIINIIYENKENGYFVADSPDSAQKLIKYEGQSIKNNTIHFQLQTVEELLTDPLSKEELELISKQKQQVQEKQTKKEKPKFIPKSAEKEDKIAQKQKVEETKLQQKKVQQNVQKFKLYSFEIDNFKKKDDFKQFMKTVNLQIDKHYKNMKSLTRKSDGLKFGQVQLLPSILNVCNNKKFKEKSIIFTPVAAE